MLKVESVEMQKPAKEARGMVPEVRTVKLVRLLARSLRVYTSSETEVVPRNLLAALERSIYALQDVVRASTQPWCRQQQSEWQGRRGKSALAGLVPSQRRFRSTTPLGNRRYLVRRARCRLLEVRAHLETICGCRGLAVWPRESALAVEVRMRLRHPDLLRGEELVQLPTEVVINVLLCLVDASVHSVAVWLSQLNE